MKCVRLSLIFARLLTLSHTDHALLDKLHSFGIDPNLISWICSYLTERKQHVIYDGVLSKGIPVLLGVPQGSVLGPLLFLIYIDDVTSEHLSQDSMLNLFADDMLLFKPITSVRFSSPTRRQRIYQKLD